MNKASAPLLFALLLFGSVQCKTHDTSTLDDAVNEPAPPLLAQLYEWVDVAPAYLKTQKDDYLVTFGQFSAGELRPAAEGVRYAVVYRSKVEKDVIDSFIKSKKVTAIFNHGVFVGKADYNKPFSWVARPTGSSFAEMAIEVCDGSPDYLEKTVQEKASGWAGITVDGKKVPHICFWGDSPIQVTKNGKTVWTHPKFKK